MNTILVLGIAYLSGRLFEKVKLTKIVGFIIVGVIMGPFGLNGIDSLVLDYSNELRKIALMIVLTKAGLSLKWKDLKIMGRPAFLLSFVPACFEIAGICVAAILLLGFDLEESLVLGTIIAAVSPAIVVPRMIKLIKDRRGTEKAIPQMIMASASVDDIFVVILFSVFTQMAKGNSFDLTSMTKIPVSIIMGIILGLTVGLLFYYMTKHIASNLMKALILVIMTMSLLYVDEAINQVIATSTLLSIMASGFMISYQSLDMAKVMVHYYTKLWFAAEIILFVLLGASIDIGLMKSGSPLIVVVLMTGLFLRSIGVMISLIRTKLNKKERLFCVLAYCPKATVQATLGGVPLAMGIANGEWMQIIAVFSIVLTAPISAILMDYFAPKLLLKQKVGH